MVRARAGATSGLRRQPREVTFWSRWPRGRLWVEIVLALAVGVAAFAIAALVCTAARSHVPAVLLGLLLLLIVLAVARGAGILYALPVGVVTILAFDWFFLPPLRTFDTATAFVLGLFLVMSVSVGAVANKAGRRAVASEQARAVLAEEQAALRRVATLVARQSSPAEIFAAVTEEVGRLFNLDMAQLFVRDGETMTVVGAWSLRGPLAIPIGLQLELEGDVVATRAFHAQRPVRMDDYSQAQGPDAEHVRSLGVRSAAGTPIVVEGRTWGVMTVASLRPEPLPAGTEERIGAFAELVATAIANAESQAQIGRLAEEQAALRRVATLVALGAHEDEVFAAVAKETGQVLAADVGCVLRYEADATATVVAVWGDARSWPVGSNWPLEGDSAASQVFRTRRPARMESYSEASGEIATLARQEGRATGAGAPIIIDDRMWGVAVVSLPSGRPLPADAEGRVARFTDLAATAIANAEVRAELTASRARVVASADEARRRLERDLHDGIQQRLVSLALKARAAETMTPRPSNQIRDELSLLASGLTAALDELREIAHGIHPAVLSEAGLGPALRALARRSAVPVTLEVNLGSRLQDPIEVAAYYVVSEALANAAKYAQASTIEVRIADHDGELAVYIHDDGIGGADPSRGSGIIGLKDRVEALGGRISVVSPPGGGTTVQVRLSSTMRTANDTPTQ
jgi:signal transduction histidine kinase